MSRVTQIARRLPARLRPHLAAVLVGAGALVLVAGGSATAAALITNSQIANGAVSKSKIRADAVGAAELTDRNDTNVGGAAVKWYNIAPGQVGTGILADGGVGMDDLSQDVQDQLGKAGEPGPAGPEGPAGPAGPAGKAGADGTDGVSGYEVIGRTADAQDVASTEPVTITSDCASHGEVAIGGGANTTGTATVVASYPGHVKPFVPPGTEGDEAGRWKADGWTVKVTGTGHVQPYVVCANMN